MFFFLFSADPTFSAPIQNVTAPVGREAMLTCVVQDLGSYKVTFFSSVNYLIWPSKKILFCLPYFNKICTLVNCADIREFSFKFTYFHIYIVHTYFLCGNAFIAKLSKWKWIYFIHDWTFISEYVGKFDLGSIFYPSQYRINILDKNCWLMYFNVAFLI